jgi:hypothetical protein
MGKHAHRWTLRTGPQVVSSADASGSGHRHEIRGAVSGPPVSAGAGHVHKLMVDKLELESGPEISVELAGKDMDDYGTGLGHKTVESLASARGVRKGILPDLVDPEHTYVFKTGELGLFDFWYVDRGNNYWRYSNAPEDHPEYDENLGIPIMYRNQPTPAENPQFFTFEGSKRHMSIPEDLLPERNDSYDPVSSENIWFESYDQEGVLRYVYLDSDIRENVDLWVQYQLRIVDANLPDLREFVVEKFNKPHVKDKIVAAVLMLMDQGLYELDDLLNAVVADLEFIDDTVKLLGRKFVTDGYFFDFLTSLKTGREGSAPLFLVPSINGEGSLGVRHVASIMQYLRVSPTYLLSWHASLIYSKVLNRLALEDVDPEHADGAALSEVKRTFGTQKDLQYLIDTRLRSSLLENYSEAFNKSIVPRVEADDYAVLSIDSDLLGRKEDEKEFSTWLHITPFHDLTPEEEAEVEGAINEAFLLAEEEEGDVPETDEEGAVQDSDQEGDAMDTNEVGKEQA